MIEDHINFLKKIDELKPYIVKWNEDNIIKLKVYTSKYIINGKEQWPIMVKIHDGCPFFANNGIQ